MLTGKYVKVANHVPGSTQSRKGVAAMKKLEFYLACIVVIIFVTGFCLVSRSRAQSVVTLTPSQLTFVGTRCNGQSARFPTLLKCDATMTRGMLIQSTQPLSEVQMIPLDLSRSDNLAMIPAKAITVTPLNDIQANKPVTISITVDLKGVPSGKFTGNLFMSYADGGQTIPLTVTVKDPWLIPLLVLVTGVLLGIGVGAYRTSGRERDLVRVQAGRLRTSLRADTELPAAFRNRIEGYLLQADLSLDGEQTAEASTASSSASGIWKKWLDKRADWLALFEYQAMLAKRCETNGDLANAVPYQQSLCRAIQEAGRDGPDHDNPSELRVKLDGLAQQINIYQKILASLDYVRNRIKQLQDAGTQKTWKDKLELWQSRLDLQTSDKLDDQLEADVRKGRDELDQAVEQQSSVPGPVKDRIVVPSAEHLSGPPSLRETTQENFSLQGAQWRLDLFRVASYLIAIILLSGIGFNELYVAKDTFGAAPWGDYFGLLAWGFGAEATRQAVTGVLKTWNLPGLPS